MPSASIAITRRSVAIAGAIAIGSFEFVAISRRSTTVSSTHPSFAITIARLVTVWPRAVEKKKVVADDDLLGGGPLAAKDEDEDAGSSLSEGEASDDGAAASAGGQAKAKSEVVVARQYWKIRPTRQGMAAQTWLQLLRVMAPSQVVLAGSVTFQVGILVAVLQHNDARFGLSLCSLVAFCQSMTRGQDPMDWTAQDVKMWQAGHLSMHTIDTAILAHARARMEALRLAANLARPTGRALKKNGTDSGEATVALDLCHGSGALATTQGAGGATPRADAPPPALCITLKGNVGGASPVWLQPPTIEEDEPDSDDPDGAHPSSDVSQDTMHKRNSRWFNKHPLKVMFVSDIVGNGCFAREDRQQWIGVSPRHMCNGSSRDRQRRRFPTRDTSCPTTSHSPSPNVCPSRTAGPEAGNGKQWPSSSSPLHSPWHHPPDVCRSGGRGELHSACQGAVVPLDRRVGAVDGEVAPGLECHVPHTGRQDRHRHAGREQA